MADDPDADGGPWRPGRPRMEMPDAGSDPRMTALARAILSPNPHNRQPWVVALEGDEALDLYCDLDRRLPETDPFDRQVTIGFGCFIELYRLAAAAQGRGLRIEPFPDGEPGDRLDGRRIARLTFDGPGDRDPLIEALPRRAELQGAVRDRPRGARLGAGVPGRRRSDAAGQDNGDGRAWAAGCLACVDLGKRICERWSRPAKLQESVDLMRIAAGRSRPARTEIDLGGPMMAVLAAGGGAGDPEHIGRSRLDRLPPGARSL